MNRPPFVLALSATFFTIVGAPDLSALLLEPAPGDPLLGALLNGGIGAAALLILIRWYREDNLYRREADERREKREAELSREQTKALTLATTALQQNAESMTVFARVLDRLTKEEVR